MLNPSKKANKAFQDGTLFVHMFEFAQDDSDTYDMGDRQNRGFKGFFDALSGKEGTQFSNLYHVFKARPEGVVGLPTTMMKKGYPVTLFQSMSTIGVMFDGNDQQHVKPLLINAHDSWSTVRPEHIQYMSCDMPENMAQAQDLRSGDSQRHRIPEDLPKLIENGRKAMPLLWQHIGEVGWDRYANRQSMAKGMNECAIAAHSKGVCGLIISKDVRGGEHLVTERLRLDIKRVAILQRWLGEHFKDQFPEPLPVFYYDPDRKQGQLVQLTPEQMKCPEKLELQHVCMARS